MFQSASLAADVNCVKFLQDIAHEQQFEVTFVDIEERAASGTYSNIFVIWIYTSRKFMVYLKK